MVMSGSLEPEASIIDAAMVQEPMVLLAAAGIVLHNYKKNALRARSLHAELVYTLSGSKHVRKSSAYHSLLLCHTVALSRIQNGSH